jgi:hypothetical protein
MCAALVKRRGRGQQAMLCAALVVLPSLLRLLIEPEPGTMPFLSFWPTVLLGTLLLDTGFAVLALFGSLAVAFALLPGRSSASSGTDARSCRWSWA